MKRSINIILTLAVVMTGLLAAYADSGSGQGYDPTDPPEPDERYRVEAVAAPSQAGWISNNNGLYAPGEEVSLYAYDNESFVFSCWKDGETTVSTDRNYTFTMPRHGVHLVAFYDYAPVSPAEPVLKHWVRIYCSPSEGGYVYPGQSFLLEEGESTQVSVSPRENYVFQGWKHDGVILPNDMNGNPQNPLSITMGDHNLEYTAIFSVKSPIEPGTNSFDSKTGRMIIDDFRPGELCSKVIDFLQKHHVQDSDEIFSNKVNEVVVIGPISPSDFSFLRDLQNYYGYTLPNCTVLDFSRTSASDPANHTVPSGAFSDMSALVKVVLPANLTGIESYAFNNCSNLSEIVCYGTMPAPASNESFGNLDSGVLLRVPSEAKSLYEAAEGWKRFSAEALDSESFRIILTLPDEAKDGRYRNMTLVLENPKSGRVQRLVVNDRLEYVFSNLMPDSDYDLYLRNEAGETLASITGIHTTGSGDVEKVLEVDFGNNIKNLVDLSLKVTAPGQGDVTDKVEIRWLDSNQGYLSSGSSLKKVIEGSLRYCQIVLPQYLGTEYEVPEMMKIVASTDESVTETVLTRLPKKPVTGKVYDAGTGKPLRNAYISVEQLIADKYVHHVHTLTDDYGVYWTEVVASPMTKGKINSGIDEYIPQTIEVADFSILASGNDFALKPISGVRILPELNWYPVSGKGPVSYDDKANLEFSLWNRTTGFPIEQFVVQNPDIVILDKVSDGSEIMVTVGARKGEFEHSQGSVMVRNSDTNKVSIDLVEHGMIEVSCAAPMEMEVNAVLYDENGRLAATVEFDSDMKASMTNIKAGRYTLVAMMDNRFYRGINSLDALQRVGLASDKDFLKAQVEVNDGKVTRVEFGTVPVLNDPNFLSDVNLTVNKTALTVGNYVTVRAQVRFNDPNISAYALRFDLPEHCSFVNNSVIKGNEPSNGQMRNGALWIDDVKEGDLVRFCLMPEKGEEYRPTAFAEFEYDGGHVSQPIGSVRFVGEDFTILVPKRTCRNHVYARGVTTSISDVTLLTNGIPTGNCRSTADGKWVAKVDLVDPEEFPMQQIYGEILDPRGKKFPTLSTVVEYDPYFPELEVVKMVHNGTVVNFDHTKAKTDRKSYSYQPSNDMFSLMAKFDENRERVTEVNFHIISTDGTERIIDGVYVESKDAWVAALGYPDSHRLPVNVTVDFVYTKPVPDPENPGETIGAFSDFYMGYIAPDVTPIIDPSGFVYEAVEENRLEGVKVTVFYREGRENIFGEIEWNAVKWDAEEYAQENPLFTDADGCYAWDVPQGEWQVKFEKDGYDTAYSAWLPVPPPQLEVNMGLVQNTRPNVLEAHAYSKGVDILFDKPMSLRTLTTENIKLSANGAELQGSIVVPEENSGNPMSKVRFELNDELAVNTGELKLIVSSQVRSYADITMLEEYTQDLSIQKEITEINGGNTDEVTLAEPTHILVSVLPVEAAVGRTLTVINDSPDVLDLENESAKYVLDENGQAKVNLTGFIPGVAKLTFGVKASDVVGVKQIEVKNKVVDTQMPDASLANGTGIFDGTEIRLSTTTPQAVIYYTLDGTEPSKENGIMYIAPFVVNSDATVKAMAVAGGNESPVAIFEYPAKRSKVDIRFNDGWNWISHNLTSSLKVEDVAGDNVMQILSIDEETVRDPKLGWVGDLNELTASKSYKVRSNGASEATSFEDVAVNPSKAISMKEGWNWIAYSPTQTMTPGEALAGVLAEKDDIISGQNGFAIFDGEQWIGELKTLTPGSGYMYRSNSEKDLVFNTSIVSNAGALYAPSRKSVSGRWIVDRRKYPSVMPVIANIVDGEGQVADEATYRVYAFSGTECRGVGSYIDGCFMMSVYGNPGDEISFRILPEGSDDMIQLKDIKKFTEMPLGSLGVPYQLDLSKSAGVEGVYDEENDILVISGRVLTVNGNVESIEVFDTEGHKLRAVYDGSNTLSLTELTPGVHIVVVKADGKWTYHKVMLK